MPGDKVDGRAIWATLQGVQALHRQVGALLGDAEEHLTHARGLRSARSRSTTDGGAQLRDPHKWMPHAVFRFYRPPGGETTLGFVSVILAPRSPEMHARPFVEPLVSAGWLRYKTAVTMGPSVYGWALMITRADVDRNGTWAGRDRVHRWNDGPSDFACLAVPLVDVVDSTVLVARVCDPLAEVLTVK